MIHISSTIILTALFSLFVAGQAVAAVSPEDAFSSDKGVGEASLRVMRVLNVPDVQIEKGDIESTLFSENCGILGCELSYLVTQSFSWPTIVTGSVAALVTYNIQGDLVSVEVIAETGR